MPSFACAVAEALARIMPADKRAKPVLLEGLRDGDPSVRKAAAEALGNVGVDALTTPALVAALTDPNSAVRWAAAEALGRAESEAEVAVPALMRALADPQVRSIAADSLGEIGPAAQAALPALCDLLKDPDRNVRWTAALALVRIRTSAAEPAAPLFVEALKSPDPRTRWDAVWYLQQLPRPERFVSGIVALLKHADPGVRTSALEALGNIGEEAKSALPVIKESLRDPSNNVRLAAARALSLIRVEDLATARAAALPLIALLAELGQPEWMREDAEWYLNRLGPTEQVVVPAYVGMLRDKRPGVRAWGLAALGRLGADAVPALQEIIRALQDENALVRVAAASAVWDIKEEAARCVPVLVAALHDPDDATRIRAAELLRDIGPRASLRPPPCKQR